ncbi:MAG: hypothetical protein LC777_14455 [Actinobacteria bacterium]|nr:hypothetical protein [Actinomycetota bacterium]
MEYRFYLGELPSIDPAWAFMAGEIMFNLRASLDYLAYELHVRRFRGAVPRGVEFTTQFPIYQDPGAFSRNGKRIKHLSQRDRTALKHLQPYVARRDKWAHVRRDLADLNALHNVDKHRKLHVVASAQVLALAVNFPPSVGFHSKPVWGPVESHAHVETWTFTKLPPEMQDYRGARLTVGLEHGDDTVDLIAVLESYIYSVGRVIDRFSNRF